MYPSINILISFGTFIQTIIYISYYIYIYIYIYIYLYIFIYIYIYIYISIRIFYFNFNYVNQLISILIASQFILHITEGTKYL